MKKSNKLLSILLTLALTVGLCFSYAELFGPVAFADDTNYMTVVDGRTTGKTQQETDKTVYSKVEYNALANRYYYYSGINTWGSFEKTSSRVNGVKLSDLFQLSGITGISDSCVVKFTASDGFVSYVNYGSLMSSRYYYPNIESLNGVKGPYDEEKSLEQRISVEPIISTDSYESSPRLYYGQLYPSERNWPNFAKMVVRVDLCDNKGTKKLDSPILSGVNDNDIVEFGAEINFNTNTKGTIYYTTDGTTPSEKSAIYNYATNKDFTDNVPAKMTKAGQVTVKAIVIGGNLESSKKATNKGTEYTTSDVATFKFTVKKGNVSGKKITVADCVYNGGAQTPAVSVDGLVAGTDYDVSYSNNVNYGYATATITGKGNYEGTASASFAITPNQIAIKKVSKASKKFTVKFKKAAKKLKYDGYQVAYSKDNATWALKNVSKKKTSVTVKKLQKKTTYYVMARAYKNTATGTVYGPYSPVKTVKVK